MKFSNYFQNWRDKKKVCLVAWQFWFLDKRGVPVPPLSVISWSYTLTWTSLHSDAELAFRRAVLTHTRMWRPIHRARLGTLIEETLYPAAGFSRTLSAVRKCSWLKLGKSRLTETRVGWPEQLRLLPVPCLAAYGSLHKLGKTDFLRHVLSGYELEGLDLAGCHWQWFLVARFGC